jgi:hypothetical protein
MTYTLPVSHHSPKQLRRLQSKATRATLMKLGFNRNTAHRVVYGPSRYGGLGFRDFAVEQGISQVELFIRHMRAGSPQGKLLRITLSWWQLVMGVSSPLLEGISGTMHPTPGKTLALQHAQLLIEDERVNFHCRGGSNHPPTTATGRRVSDGCNPLDSGYFHCPR